MSSIKKCIGEDTLVIVQFAAVTRLLSLLLQAILNAVIPDHVPDAFRPPRSEDPLLLDPLIEALFGGLSHWDAEHFLFIAEHGYLYEHNFAFFPLFPVILRTVASLILLPLCGFLTMHGRLLLSVVIVNSVLFVLGAVALCRLSRLVLQDRKLVLVVGVMYCVTPANVFMLAGYSETLFAALTFAGLYLLEKSFTFGGCLLLGFATGARANGLVNVGFLLYLSLQRSLNRAKVFTKVEHSRYCNFTWELLHFVLTGTVCAAIVLLPFCVFQFYGYQTFCHPTARLISPKLLKLAQVKGYRVADGTFPVPSWCQWQIPLLYSYIQDEYWDVGFFRYFHWKQTPNFILATPVATLGFLSLYLYVSANPEFSLYMGMRDRGKDKEMQGFYNPRVFVYVVHSSFLLLFGILCMHVQVLTRFLASSSPMLYWIAGHLLFQNEPLLQNAELFRLDGKQDHKHGFTPILKNNPVLYLLIHWKTCSMWTQCILGYFILYWFIGLALHCNFLPWT